MWFFSYLGNGMNMKDVALVKYSNIVGDEIHFVRSKTSESTIDRQRIIQICLQDELREIIDRWGKRIQRPGSYIFDIIDKKDSSPLRIHKDISQAIKSSNIVMFKISKELKLDKRPTCNFARHTYSTVLKRANVPIAAISEALGHFSVKTTEIYLDSFESETRAEISKNLM